MNNVINTVEKYKDLILDAERFIWRHPETGYKEFETSKYMEEKFRELGYEYLKYKGENFIRCRECDVLVRNNKCGDKKYCSNCAGYVPMERKQVTCVDCGVEFTVNSKNNKTHRCSYCQKEYVRAYDRERKKRDNSV